MIRELVNKKGLPNVAVEKAIKLGIFKPHIRNPEAFQELPENIQFRIYSVLVWAEIFIAILRKMCE